MIANGDMTRQGDLVGQNAVVTDHAVMPDMHVGHQQIARTNSRFAAILNGTTMDRGAFTNHIIIAHD